MRSTEYIKKSDELDYELLEAVKCRQIGLVRKLLNEGAQITSSRSGFSFNALHFAIYYFDENKELLHVLLESNALTVNAFFEEKTYEFSDFLTPIQLALYYKYWDAILLVVEKTKNTAIFKQLKPQLEQALFEAMEHENVSVLARLLQLGRDNPNQYIDPYHWLDSDEDTIFHCAIRKSKSNPQLLQIIIDNPVPPQSIPHFALLFYRKNQEQVTPLEMAVKYELWNAIKLIITSPNANHIPKQQLGFILYHAVKEREYCFIEFLLKTGAQIDYVESDNYFNSLNTILHLAVFYFEQDSKVLHLFAEHPFIIAPLLKSRNHNGKTPMGLAVGNQHAMSLLEKIGRGKKNETQVNKSKEIGHTAKFFFNSPRTINQNKVFEDNSFAL